MTHNPKLTDLQLILLTNAAQRADGSLLPPPDSATEQRDRISKAVAALIKRSLASEVDVPEQSCSWRNEGDRLIGAVISDEGRIAIGTEPTPSGQESGSESPELDQAPPASSGNDAGQPQDTPTTPRAGSKQALVIELLSRTGGATLAELVEATSWLPHTTRAALTGLRKKGHAIRKSRRDEVTCYHMGEAA